MHADCSCPSIERVMLQQDTLCSCLLQGLLVRVLDGNQHVQEAACSALAIVEECTHPSLLAVHLQVSCCLISSNTAAHQLLLAAVSAQGRHPQLARGVAACMLEPVPLSTSWAPMACMPVLMA